MKIAQWATADSPAALGVRKASVPPRISSAGARCVTLAAAVNHTHLCQQAAASPAPVYHS